MGDLVETLRKAHAQGDGSLMSAGLLSIAADAIEDLQEEVQELQATIKILQNLYGFKEIT
jgi:hypothetical protein